MDVKLKNTNEIEEMGDLKIDTLCDLSKKDLEKHLNKIIKFVDDPKYICVKCGRVANKKSLLCKEKKIK